MNQVTDVHDDISQIGDDLESLNKLVSGLVSVLLWMFVEHGNQGL